MFELKFVNESRIEGNHLVGSGSVRVKQNNISMEKQVFAPAVFRKILFFFQIEDDR